MPDFDLSDAERPTNFDDVSLNVWSKLYESGVLGHTVGAVSGWITWGIMGAVAVLIRVAVPVAATIARGIARGEEASETSFGDLAAVTVEHVLGVRAGGGTWQPRSSAGNRTGVIDQIGNTFLNALAPSGGGVLEPSTQGINKFLAMPFRIALEGWLEGWIIEMLTDIPSMPGVKTYAELPALLMEGLGLGRLSRSVLRPLIDTTVVTPATWALHKTYRPTLLPVGDSVRQFARGRWTQERLDEELGRHGYSQDRVDALIVVNRLHLSVGEIAEGYQLGMWGEPVAVTMLKDLGYLEDTAHTVLALTRFREQNKQMRAIADLAISAYEHGTIDRGQLDTAIVNAVWEPSERDAWRQRAEAARLFRVHGNSEGQLEHAVRRGILPMSEYRRGLRRLGYDEDAVTTLELLLRDTIHDANEAAQHKKDLLAEKAREKAQKAADDAKKKADLEFKRLHPEPALASVQRAVVRGLVDPSYLSGYLTAHHYSGDVVQFLVTGATQDRAAYVARLKAAADAHQRATRSGLSTGELESAVERGLLSDAEYRRVLTQGGMAAADVDTLVAVADEKHADREAALKKRADAEKRAATRKISLPELERAVRKGVTPVGQYQATLAADGFDAGDQATLTALLQTEIAADQAAAAKRREAEQKAATKGISLAKEERAVLDGVRSLDDYRALLRTLGYSGADLATLTDLLGHELEAAQAARLKKQQLEDRLKHKPLPLATVERAVAQNVLTLTQFRDYLTKAGVTGADQDTLVSLVTLQIQSTAALKARRAAIAAEKSQRSLSLAETERLVKAGLRTLDDYRAELARLGFDPADRTALATLLEEEQALANDAAKRHTQILAEGTSKALTLAQEEKAVKDGDRSLAQFAQYLQREGYDVADQALLVQTLARSLP